jgi:hypothetical protein
MTIEQKEWEIAEAVRDNWEVEHKGLEFAVAKHAARLGIIEGLEMAAKWHDEQAKVYDNCADQEWDDRAAEKFYRQRANQHREYAKTIRALIEEQKP